MKRLTHLLIGITSMACVRLLLADTAQCTVPGDPPTFSDPLNIDNRYTPFSPGRLRVLSGKDVDGVTKVVVDLFLAGTRTFLWNDSEVTCRILETLDFDGGRLDGVSKMYLAQADDGTVYFFGEITTTYVNADTVVHHGSWLVGGSTLSSDPPFPEWRADPTVFMLAQPDLGDDFKREDISPFLDETNEITGVGLDVTVPGGEFEDVIHVTETSEVETDKRDFKWYAPGVGMIKSVDPDETLELVASTSQGVIPTGIDFWNLIR